MIFLKKNKFQDPYLIFDLEFLEIMRNLRVKNPKDFMYCDQN